MREIETTTRRVKVPDGLNIHAITAWWYIGETAKACKDAIKDYEFTCLLRDLYDAYPDEYEFYLDVTSEG